MPKSRQPAPLAHPPPLYRASQSDPLVQISNQTLSPPTSIAHQISPPPFSPVSRTHQSRKVPRNLETSPSNSDRSKFLLPPQTGLTSPTAQSFNQYLFSPSLTSPFISRRPSTSFILDSQRTYIQRKTLTEIHILTNIQYSQLKLLCSNRTISPYDSEIWEAMLSSEKFPT